MKETLLNESHILTCKCGTSFSSVLGNVTSLIKDYVHSVFPKGYINNVYVDTKDLSGDLEEEDVIRKDKPILVIKPKFDYSADNGIMGRLPDWQHKNYFIFKQPGFHYIPVLGDVENDLYIYSIPERMKVSFDITVIFNTKMEAMNTAYYFRGSVLHKSYFYMNDVFLETEIPKSMILTIANKLGLDLNNNDDKRDLLEYLNNYSMNKITRKTKTSSGIEQYFYKYKVNLLSMFPEYPEVDDGENVGQVSTGYRMTTSLDIEFTCPYNYILESGKTVKIAELDEEESRYLLQDTFSINTTIPDPPEIEKVDEEQHKKLVVWEGYITDTDVVDVLDISPVMFDSLDTVINYCLDESTDTNISDVFDTVLFKGKYAIPPSDYRFEWSSREVINLRPVKDETYHFGIYMDTKKANIILEELDKGELVHQFINIDK